jgi:biopolymer transport protein ExbD/type 1 glutamine amidotransferase
VPTADCTDNDEKERRAEGLLALQLHAGPPMKVQFKNIKLKRAKSDKAAAAEREDADAIVMTIDQKKQIWVAGERTKQEDVVESLAEQFRKTGGAELHMRAHEDLTIEYTAELLNLAHKAGIQRVTMKAFVTVKEAKNKEAAKTSDFKTKSKKVVLIAGRKSHGFGAHEHKAGCMLLADALNNSGLGIKAEVVTDGWPQDESVLDDADSIVIYSDGGGGHPFNQHLEKLDALMKNGVGLVCIHYGVEVPAKPAGEAFLDWTGGYFEANWSVNPHWDANYAKLPEHPITRGVKPFKINDEWYYHMRFREELAGVTPILSDLPPESTLSRPDGPHSGNPTVRKPIANGETQHMAWARQREDGGRGFGFTGGHFHWNWGNDQFRKLVLNAIAWTAHAEVPDSGVPSKSLTAGDLMANQDEDVPDNFNPERIQKMIEEWNK